MKNLTRFRGFVHDFMRLVERAGDDEARILQAGGDLLAYLVRHDD